MLGGCYCLFIFPRRASVSCITFGKSPMDWILPNIHIEPFCNLKNERRVFENYQSRHNTHGNPHNLQSKKKCRNKKKYPTTTTTTTESERPNIRPNNTDTNQKTASPQNSRHPLYNTDPQRSGHPEQYGIEVSLACPMGVVLLIKLRNQARQRYPSLESIVCPNNLQFEEVSKWTKKILCKTWNTIQCKTWNTIQILMPFSYKQKQKLWRDYQ